MNSTIQLGSADVVYHIRLRHNNIIKRSDRAPSSGQSALVRVRGTLQYNYARSGHSTTNPLVLVRLTAARVQTFRIYTLVVPM